MKTVYFIIIMVCMAGILAPLIWKLGQKIVKSFKEAKNNKNWGPFIAMLFSYIREAEKMFKTGAAKKQWVMGMVEHTENETGFHIDKDRLGQLIDDAVSMTKHVNVPAVA